MKPYNHNTKIFLDNPRIQTPLIPASIVITGPTASGKSDLALELAQEIEGEIVCTDSMQVYRGLDIGTAKPTKAEQLAVPHHQMTFATLMNIIRRAVCP